MDNSSSFSEDASRHFTEKVLVFLREQIRSYQGQEILFGGRINPEISLDKIGECEIITRGNHNQVPILTHHPRYHVLIHNHPSSYLTPSTEDLEIAAERADQVGFMIIDNAVEKVNVVIPIPQVQDQPIDAAAVLNAFEPQGTLSQVLPEFDSRPPQKNMVSLVTEAFNQGMVLLCEAETGTGKSLGYGIPAGYWALRNKKKVVISTNTINLQEQLLNKDLPIIRECLRKEVGSAPEIVLVKGKNNYLCLRKFEEFKKELADTQNLPPEEKIGLGFKNEILAWGEKTQTGDKNELSFIPDYALWDRLGCENDTCQRKYCRFETRCFQGKMRKQLSQSDILIVNHHILCADLVIKKELGFQSTGLLPPYQHLIIDESHHLEDVATIYFGSQASTFEVKRTLGLIARIDFKKKVLRGGLLSRILNDCNESTSNGSAVRWRDFQETLHSQINEFVEARIIYEDNSLGCLDKILSYFTHQEAETFFISEEDQPVRKEYKRRFRREEMDEERWIKNYREPLEQLVDYVQSLIDILSRLQKTLTPYIGESEGRVQDSLTSSLSELIACRERLAVMVSTFQASCQYPERDEVRWIKMSQIKNQVYFSTHVSPLEIGHLLRENLFYPLKTIILTSATLSTNSEKDPFHHIKERLGITELSPQRVKEIQLSNAFDYARNCRMILPPGLPPVNGKEFISALVVHLHQLLDIFRGRMLWLFTSYSMMKTIHRRLENTASDLGVDLWIQGEETRHKLIRKIKEHRHGVILGVSSFWEGVDIKGESLSCLVMIKLPFAVPDEPILGARLERLEEMGKNSFVDYSLPQAILRFKQGFGRLIRSPQDRGVFILFDNRIITKNYGRDFIKSLPPGVTPDTRAIEQEWIDQFFHDSIE